MVGSPGWSQLTCRGRKVEPEARITCFPERTSMFTLGEGSVWVSLEPDCDAAVPSNPSCLQEEKNSRSDCRSAKRKKEHGRPVGSTLRFSHSCGKTVSNSTAAAVDVIVTPPSRGKRIYDLYVPTIDDGSTQPIIARHITGSFGLTT